MAEGKVIIVNPDMFGKDPDSKTTKANEVAKSFGLSDAALAEVEDFKAQLTKHNAWDLPFMGYVNEDGYGYAYVPGAAVVYDPYWDAHQAFLALPKDVHVPLEISSSPAIIRSVVDLPHPDGPTKMINSLSSISRLKSLTASKPFG